MTTKKNHPPLQKPDVIPFTSLPGMLQRMDIMLETFALGRAQAVDRATASGNAAWIVSYDIYVSNYRQERDELAALLATAEEQEEQRGEENQIRRDA